MSRLFPRRDPDVVVDQLIVFPHAAELPGRALIDATSFLNLHLFTDPTVARRLNPEFLHSESMFRDVGHVLQAVVLHDELLIDSVLLEQTQGLHRFATDHRSIFRGVFVPRQMRMSVGGLMDRMLSDRSLIVEEPAIDSETRKELVRITSIEQGWYEQAAEDEWVTLVPQGFDKVTQRREALSTMPSVLIRSGRTLGRALFYVLLGMALRTTLAVHPARADLIKRLKVPKTRDDIASNLARHAEAEQKARVQDATDGIIDVNLSVPAIPELVYTRALHRKIALLDAAMEIRNENHATAFRKWCNSVVANAALGRAGAESVASAVEHAKDLIRAWSEDVDADVRYIKRTLSLAEIPAIGSVFEFAGLGTITMRDPLLVSRPSVRPLLFLNDLMRGPQRVS